MTRNPWLAWTWVTCLLAQAVSWPALLVLHAWWGLLGYLPWLLAIAAMFRWEAVRSPRKMYGAWRP